MRKFLIQNMHSVYQNDHHTSLWYVEKSRYINIVTQRNPTRTSASYDRLISGSNFSRGKITFVAAHANLRTSQWWKGIISHELLSHSLSQRALLLARVVAPLNIPPCAPDRCQCCGCSHCYCFCYCHCHCHGRCPLLLLLSDLITIFPDSSVGYR